MYMDIYNSLSFACITLNKWAYWIDVKTVAEGAAVVAQLFCHVAYPRKFSLAASINLNGSYLHSFALKY